MSQNLLQSPLIQGPYISLLLKRSFISASLTRVFTYKTFLQKVVHTFEDTFSIIMSFLLPECIAWDCKFIVYYQCAAVFLSVSLWCSWGVMSSLIFGLFHFLCFLSVVTCCSSCLAHGNVSSKWFIIFKRLFAILSIQPHISLWSIHFRIQNHLCLLSFNTTKKNPWSYIITSMLQ